MFDRRLKFLLLFLLGVTVLLILRAAQVQLVNGDYWSKRASGLMQKTLFTETTRGRILDYVGREIALDQACIDVCVDYRAIMKPAEPRWLREKAITRLKNRLGVSGRKLTRQQIEEETQAVQNDIDAMWIELARVYRAQVNNQIDESHATEVIEDIRRAIEQKVEMRRRYIWYSNYEKALKEHGDRAPQPWYRQWLVSTESETPRFDSFVIDVVEQTQAHVVLRAIDAQTSNRLSKNADQYPGLSLPPSAHRVYPFPYNRAGCHFIGRLSRVNQDDLKNDPSGTDPLREYLPNDLIGRDGIEKLCEPLLRGERGQLVKDETDRELAAKPSRAGSDVSISIDIELQGQVQDLFAHAPIVLNDKVIHERMMHGAAVVIDVPTGQVRALASYPDYDLNLLDEQYAILQRDEINMPMLNRATRAALEPGSTVKPIIGLGAITSGVLGPYETIECKGYLDLAGKRQTFAPRCWVLSMWGNKLKELGVSPSHHPIPFDHPSPTGFLDLAEGLQRSCNIYFETAADRLGLEGVTDWFDRFGLGRRTGIGISESPGRRPNPQLGIKRRLMTWYAGIGQGQVAATPLQMANVAATIARDGVWMRPSLIKDEERKPEDIVDLQISPEGLRRAREGMGRVVSSPDGSGYKFLHRSDVTVAGKSGSAQAAKFTIRQRDEQGNVIKDETGRELRQIIQPSTETDTNPQAPWYLARGPEGKELTHSWFIGFAPLDKPQIAFAVLIEYGGAGGQAAAPLAAKVLDACIEHGYLKPRGK